MKIIEQIRTTKGAYSLSLAIMDNGNAIVSIGDPESQTSMRLDTVDLRRIQLLIQDHILDMESNDV